MRRRRATRRGHLLQEAFDAVSTAGLECGDSEGRLRVDIGQLTVVSVYVPSGSSKEERQLRKYEYMDHLYGSRKVFERRAIRACLWR